ncbi:acyl-CoA dehydrogenase [Virgisporangium aliadipatigenens]|uniref:Acyl-CoA dehydrogenase n=1 Tax=Virgisporangium aliadipatigenens TaxID=741659 RepID=A0A8J3YM97_9ACTN|nr:phosphotransferase family protein [Virgisporangium aliadipatigenens]GIJ46897.1 acyl-CoA dehydrogenase [Virgisporangium aliadipatigenens]
MSLPGLDLSQLRAYLDAFVPGLVRGPLSGSVIAGGRSNLTYTVTDGVGTWVVRRPPLGHVLATAHDMAREHKVMAALGPAGFPVPAMISLCTDDSVIGAQFYVMEHVDGTVYRGPADFASIGADGTRSLVENLVDTLADLHAIDPAAVGLGDFGRPAGYNERQVRRWKKQLDGSRSRDVPGIDELHDRLAAAIPESAAGTVVHGDYRLDNVIADGTRVKAVLDWEMSTLGDPLADVALLLVYSRREMPSGDGDPVPPLALPGHPDLKEIAARYADRSGRDLSDLNWYVAFATFKLAVILEGIHYRYSNGLTVGAGFEHIGERVGPLVDEGHRTLEEN